MPPLSQVTLTAGNTLLIPTGWIHAVFTPQDSLVFGGNWMHGLDMPGQLRIYELETFTRVPRKVRRRVLRRRTTRIMQPNTSPVHPPPIPPLSPALVAVPVPVLRAPAVVCGRVVSAVHAAASLPAAAATGAGWGGE
jgi:hypothetical protein